MEASALYGRQNRVPDWSPMVSFGHGGGLGSIKPGGATTLFLDIKMLTPGTIYTLLTNNLRIDGWIFFNDDKSGFDNGNITIQRVVVIDDQIAITFNNGNGVEKELAAITFKGDTLVYDYVNNISVGFTAAQYFAEKFTAASKNLSSINQVGELPLDINQLFGFVNLDTGALSPETIALLPDLHLNIVNHLNSAALVQAEVAYDPYLHQGKYVTIRNKESRLVSGYVTNLEHYSQGGEYRTVVTVRELT